ncbi:hypothetical protein E8L90_19660 [Brevibacillus antibioticus]|uniref:Uncharacterized protein n=1 Tax=Brevibacillus antibioticus TaxID=2570228 RepID=A0A4U2YEK6_9BACL|nr:hypothetical protein E8L90_19660 [Brevibacillus antibioticus]
MIYSKTKNYRKAIPLFEKCLELSKPNARIPKCSSRKNVEFRGVTGIQQPI